MKHETDAQETKPEDIMLVRKVISGDDIGAICDIYCHSWRAAYRGSVPQDYLDALDGSRWRPALENSGFESYVVMDGEAYAGTSIICPSRDEKMQGWGEIVAMYLLPEYFGKGYGQLLLECVVNALKEKGFEDIYLWVLDENKRARRFYEKNGFEKTGDIEIAEVGGKDLRNYRYIRHMDKTE